MNEKFYKRISASIGLGLLIFLFSGWAMADKTVRATARFTDQAELDAIRADLDKIDGYAVQGDYENASVIAGQDIRARQIYRGYLSKAAGISGDLLSIRPRLATQDSTLSLQELGAFSQRLSARNMRFKDEFQHGEDQFHTYKLIETAISNLEDAIAYWRMSNQFRRTYRGTARNRQEDDEVLQIKLQTAMNAIDELKAIMDTREKLSKDLAEE